MLSSANCRDHPRIHEDASETHSRLGGSLACSTIGAPASRGCQKRFFAGARPEPDLRYFSNATASRASLNEIGA